MNATSQRHPLYVGDVVTKLKAKGLIRVTAPMTEKQVDALKMAIKDRRRSQKKAMSL